MFEKHKVVQHECEDCKAPAKKAFSFVNLGVDLDPNDIIESNQTYLYLQSSNDIPSSMAPLDNPYDNSVKYINTHNCLYDHLNSTGVAIPRVEYDQLLEELSVVIKNRIMSNITQNINIIYKNGFEKTVKQFLIKKETSDNGYNLRSNNPVFDIRPMATWLPLFNLRDSYPDPKDVYINDFRSDKPLIVDPLSPDAMINMLDVSREIFNKVTSNYDLIISRLITEDKLDIPAFTKYILGLDDINFEAVSEESYIGIVTSALNQLASEDLAKISEIIEIAITQGSSEFYRSAIEIDKNASKVK